MPLNVELVSPERPLWSGEASMVVAKTVEGDLGVLPGHAPLLAVLANGVVRIDATEGEGVSALVLGGFLSVADDRVSILAESTERVDEIDTAAAESALREAEESGDDAAADQARARLAAAHAAS
ncbi:F-type H+-transporting ATPase subunit epsilon [Motilibacter rhizosphaerae]|uniref:ATP synthase epsilon chain n=1 Tax=Motilibacter rhizosphaerae TaxID=598652 RepID=A0A4Q7NP98_9ACTN|nr:F0F1 ATP synthase subunit epsilon [Motilibacter rhizosphaerae]RZS87099.1 F-type H+-transporting ATPase subunit epsilon [Motilibacter rhizosphaerae]